MPSWRRSTQGVVEANVASLGFAGPCRALPRKGKLAPSGNAVGLETPDLGTARAATRVGLRQRSLRVSSVEPGKWLTFWCSSRNLRHLSEPSRPPPFSIPRPPILADTRPAAAIFVRTAHSCVYRNASAARK